MSVNLKPSLDESEDKNSHLAKEGRLQRKAGKSGFKITRFREVFFRHGLLVLILSVLCFFLPNAFDSLSWGTERFQINPFLYLISGTILLTLLISISFFENKNISTRQMVWIFYLLGISISEEWIFRLVVPGFLMKYNDPVIAIVISNIIFAGMHYFTLRWRIIWCLGAFCGAMGLSRLLVYGDILFLIGIHWFATFMNTPRPPTVDPHSSHRQKTEHN